MDTVHSEINGYTFITSLEGHRLQNIHTHTVKLFIVAGVSLLGGMPDSIGYWLVLLVSLVAYSGTAFLILAHLGPVAWLRTKITVEEGHIRIVKGVDNKRLPLGDVKRIRIERARNENHRIVTLWDEKGRKHVLLDPANGAALERWASEEAVQHGVPITIRMTWFLSCEPFSTFLVCGVAAIMGALIASHLDLL